MTRILIAAALSAAALGSAAALAVAPDPVREGSHVLADKCVVSGPLTYGGKVIYPGGTYCVPLPGA